MLRTFGRNYGRRLGNLERFESSMTNRRSNELLLCNVTQTKIPLPINYSEERFFSSRRSKPGTKSASKRKILSNENLISFLMKRQNASARDIQVRLVVSNVADDGSSKNESKLVNLLEAVEHSTALDVDLVGVNLKDDIPTIKAENIEKLLYQNEKKAESKAQKQKTKTMKEFKFKAGIADHDFGRKESDLINYLKKGHGCRVTITAKGRFLRTDPRGVETVVKKLEGSEVGEIATVVKSSVNVGKTHASISLQPRQK